MQSEKNKRRALRTSLKKAYVRVFHEEESGETRYRVMVIDLSYAGVRFTSSRAFSPGIKVVLGLLFPNQEAYIEITGKVIRCKDKGKEYYIAVEFDKDHYLVNLISSYVKLMKLHDEFKT